METFIFSYPTKVYFGEGSAKQAFDAECDRMGEIVMLAYGCGSIKKNDIYEEMWVMLELAGKKIVEFGGIMPNPTYAKVQEGAALAREHHVDFILAVGGGSVIDCCKVVSAQACLGRDIWDMEYNGGKFPTEGIPMGAVVTASGTGAEMNAGAVITYEEKKWKGPVLGTAASFAVLDPSYTMTVPRMQVLSGAFDTLSHAMETFVRECGLPTKLSQLASAAEITPELLRQVADTCHIIKTNPRELDRDEIYGILMECL